MRQEDAARDSQFVQPPEGEMSALGSSTSGAARVIETLRTSTRRLMFAAVAVLLAGAVAGCSSGGAAVSPSTGAPSAPASAAAPQLLPGAGHAPVAIPAGTYAVAVNGSTIPAPVPVIRVPAGYTGRGFAVTAGTGETDRHCGRAGPPRPLLLGGPECLQQSLQGREARRRPGADRRRPRPGAVSPAVAGRK